MAAANRVLVLETVLETVWLIVRVRDVERVEDNVLDADLVIDSDADTERVGVTDFEPVRDVVRVFVGVGLGVVDRVRVALQVKPVDSQPRR
jgi:hypothetical protein